MYLYEIVLFFNLKQKEEIVITDQSPSGMVFIGGLKQCVW